MAPVRDLELRVGALEAATPPPPVGFTITATGSTIGRGLADIASDIPLVLGYIPSALHAGIKAGTNATDLQPYFQQAINATSFYVPGGDYLLGSRVVIPDSPRRVFGAGYGARLLGSFAGFILDKPTGLSTVEGPFSIEHLRIANSHASGGGVRLLGVVGAAIRGCRVEAKSAGLDLSESSFSVGVSDCRIIGSGTGFGILGGGTISNCDVVGWSEGLRHFGTGTAVVGGRFEVNRIGLRFGVDPVGADRMSSRCFIAGASFEANDTAIQLDHVASMEIEGCGIQGSGNSPSGGSVTGLHVGAATSLVVSGVGVGGTFSTAGIKIASPPTTSAFIGVGSITWNAVGVNLAGAAFIACDAGAPKAGL